MNAERLLEVYEQISEAPDAIARLQRFVLNLAVRGKLVEQNPPEKFVLSVQPSAPVVEQDEFHVPANWTWACVKDVAVTRLGKMLDKGKNKGVPKPYLRNINVRWFGFELDDLLEMPFEERELQEFQLLEGDVLVCEGGEPGRAAVWKGSNEEVYFQKALHRIRFQADIDPMFFTWVLKESAENGRLANYFTGSGIKHFTGRNLAAFRFPLPPLAEQHRIVAKVDELMALCDRLEEARKTREELRDKLTAASLARLTAPETTPEDFPTHAAFALEALPALTTRPDQIKTLRQTILNLAVRGKLVEQDPTDEPVLDYLLGLEEVPAKTRKLLRPLNSAELAGDLPHSWVWLSLGAIIRGMDAGWSPQCENQPRSNEDEWGVLKTTAVQALAFDSMQHKLLPNKLKPRPEYQAEVGDILVTRAGPKNRVGVSCVVDVPCPKLMISDKLIRFHALVDLSPRYIALTLNAGITFERIESAKSGMAVMQMNISQVKLKAIPVPLPPLAEQHRIVAKVDALMALCDRLEASLTTTDTTRTRLLESLLYEALEPVAEAMEAAE